MYRISAYVQDADDWDCSQTTANQKRRIRENNVGDDGFEEWPRDGGRETRRDEDDDDDEEEEEEEEQQERGKRKRSS
ncbi:hypothetical protein AA313_de0210239 [Arthrobotrys entomopaga]|nr:hypothetical protein AA313_de0210239 [Arthrobotrys entomopaga]